VVQKAVQYGSEALHTELRLGGVYIEPFRTLRLDELLIRDQQQDTLLYVEALKIDLTRFDRDSNYVALDEVILVHPYYNLYISEGDSVTNMQFLIDAFKNDTPDSARVTF